MMLRVAATAVFLMIMHVAPAAAQEEWSPIDDATGLRKLLLLISDLMERAKDDPGCFRVDNQYDGRGGALDEVTSIREEFAALHAAALQEMSTVPAADILARTEAETAALRDELDAAKRSGDGARYKALADQQKAIHQQAIDALHNLFDPTGMKRLNDLSVEFEKAADAAEKRIKRIPTCPPPSSVGGIRG